MAQSCRRCRRSASIEIKGRTLIQRRTGLDGQPVIETFQTVVPGQAVLEIFTALITALTFNPVPRFILLEEDRRRGGSFVGPYWVLVGRRDTDAMAQWVLNERPFDALRLHGLLGNFLSLWDFWVQHVFMHILAHELGHLLHAQGHQVPAWLQDQAAAEVDEEVRASVREEMSAEYLAGYLWGLLGWARGAGELVSYVAGCEGRRCDHPSPAWRARAFGEGYDAGLETQLVRFFQQLAA